jgi:hypothetical protein
MDGEDNEIDNAMREYLATLSPTTRERIASARHAVCSRCGRLLATHVWISCMGIDPGHVFEEICTN